MTENCSIQDRSHPENHSAIHSGLQAGTVTVIHRLPAGENHWLLLNKTRIAGFFAMEESGTGEQAAGSPARRGDPDLRNKVRSYSSFPRIEDEGELKRGTVADANERE